MTAPRRWGGGRLVVASHNAGKVREIAELLERFDVATVSAAALGLAVPDETEPTFEGNALIKARAAARASGLPALADDSGLAIDALGGAPGVHTADWAEVAGAGHAGRDFAAAMARAHREILAAGAPEPWTARFVCVLALAWPDGAETVARGEVSGRVVWPPRGANGHGYDPMFVRDGEARTFGEISSAEKHAASHRARAFEQLVARVFQPGEP